MKQIKNKPILIILVFALLLVLLSIFSQRVNFHDTPEHITAAKELAGINHSKFYSAHSLLYPLFLAQFIKLVPSI